MKILGLVTARGGSKRLPGKNIRVLGGRPLIAWTLNAAKESGVLESILVSTDDQDIAKVAMEWRGDVPWLRPAELATDTANSIDVVLHALDWFESVHSLLDGVMLLQPTSPFRTAETIRQAVELFTANGQRPVVGVSPVCVHPAWCFQVEHNSMTPMLGWDAINYRSQDLPPAYALNGAIYVATPAFLRQHRTFFTAETCPMVINKSVEALDIDTEWDWLLAENFLNSI